MRRRFTSQQNIPSPIDINNYLTIEALEDDFTTSLSINACEYCVDGDGDWKLLLANIETKSINSGQTLSFRGNLTPTLNKGIGTFTISKKCNLKGNCMSMLFDDNTANNYSLEGKDYAFYALFYNCAIVNVSSNFLPATTLANYCYYRMFSYCTSLTTAPQLPATTLAEGCYYGMFTQCTNLVNAPELPATTLAVYCYSNMFSYCTNLTVAPELPATTLVNGCYVNMFIYCTNLTVAPELPATTLVVQCYNYMFSYCSRLNYIKALFTTSPSSGCTNMWVRGVSSTGTFVKNKNATWNITGTNGIPEGWAVRTV